MKGVEIMYNCYGHYYNGYNMQQTQSYVRILHASPDAPAVDVYINDKLLASNLSYKNFTEYYSLNPGVYNIKVYPAGQMGNPVINLDIKIPPKGIYTVAAINMLKDIELYPILDTPMPIQTGKVYVRFAHLSPDAPSVDIRLPNGTNVFKDVEYKEVTDYITVNPGTYTLNVYPTGTEDRVLHIPNITLKGNRFYTVYAVGLDAGNPPLQVLIPLDGNSYLQV